MRTLEIVANALDGAQPTDGEPLHVSLVGVINCLVSITGTFLNDEFSDEVTDVIKILPALAPCRFLNNLDIFLLRQSSSTLSRARDRHDRLIHLCA